MKRWLLIILFFVVLVAPFVLRAAMGLSSPRAPATTLRLVVMTPHAESVKREFAAAFSDWHQHRFGQPVVLDYRALSANDIVKYLHAGKEAVFGKLGTYKVDIVWGGGDYLFESDLKPGGFLEPVQLDPAVTNAAFPKPQLAGVPLYDRNSPPTWFGTALSSFGIVYNKDVLRHLGLPEPRTWADLKDPRYRTWIVLADPTRSGVARSVFMVIVERAMADAPTRGESEDAGWARGMGMIRQISANARLFNDAGTAVSAWVSSGDVAASMAIDFHARSQIDAVGSDRLGYVEPLGATAVTPDPVGIVRGAPHRELAQRFIEFLLSEAGQRLWITRAGAPGGPKETSLRRLPIMASLYDTPRDFTDDAKPFAAVQGFNASAARQKTFPILGDLIDASCMSVLRELRATRAAVLESPEAPILDQYIGIFPFDQKRALELAAQWKQMPPLERLAAQRELTEQFRAEYQDLKQAAERKQPATRNVR
jgi:ABC-type Fe3+ transport system substrate-binding protein